MYKCVNLNSYSTIRSYNSMLWYDYVAVLLVCFIFFGVWPVCVLLSLRKLRSSRKVTHNHKLKDRTHD